MPPRPKKPSAPLVPNGHDWFKAERTGEDSINTGRPRYRVTCQCGGLVHRATTGPAEQFAMHRSRIERDGYDEFAPSAEALGRLSR